VNFQQVGQFGGVTDTAIASITKSASNINVVLEMIDESTKNRAQEAVRSTTQPAPSLMFGSAFGMLDGEQSAVRRYFHNDITLGTATQKCREFLRAFDVSQD
jgi:hypothetical protein